MLTIAVYCGSKFGNTPKFTEMARQVGTYIAQKNLRLIYGGGDAGLMGVVGKAALEAGGKVVEVTLPKLQDIRKSYAGLEETIVADSLQKRKAIMMERANLFLNLPGSFGTLDELTEVAAAQQLGIHRKPIGLLNFEGFYDHLLAHFHHIVATGFAHTSIENTLIIDTEVTSIINQLVSKLDI